MRESQIIQSIKHIFSDEIIGDDCAVLPGGQLISTDVMVEGVHFLHGVEPADLAWKILSVNVSDIAAMAGEAEYFSLGMSLPESISESWIEAFCIGLKEACDHYKVALTGGDLTRADIVHLSGTVLGKSGSFITRRSMAIPGQKIVLTNSTGKAAAGLWSIKQQQESDFPELAKSYHRPTARISEAQSLAKLISDNFAMMDLSDGLLDGTSQLALASQCKITLNLDKIPISTELAECASRSGITAYEYMLTGGDDYELLASCPADLTPPSPWIEIGYVSAGEGMEIYRQGQTLDWSDLRSYEHFC